MNDKSTVEVPSGRRSFVRKMVSLATLGAITGMLLGHRVDKAAASVNVISSGLNQQGSIGIWNSENDIISDDSLYWDSVNKRLEISGSGGALDTPDYILDVSDRMRVSQRQYSSGSSNSAGIWFRQRFGTGSGGTDQAFVGMLDDNRVGFYGANNSGWILTGDTVNGDVSILAGRLGVGTSSPTRSVHLLGDNACFRMDRDVNSAAFILVRTAAADFNTVWKSFYVGVDASGVNNGEFFIGDVGTNVTGPSTKRLWIDNGGTVHIPSLGSGDIKLANDFIVTEDEKLGIAFKNDAGQKIAVLDREGNLQVKGKISENPLL